MCGAPPVGVSVVELGSAAGASVCSWTPCASNECSLACTGCSGWAGASAGRAANAAGAAMQSAAMAPSAAVLRVGCFIGAGLRVGVDLLSRRPSYLASLRDLWLCVPASRRVCPDCDSCTSYFGWSADSLKSPRTDVLVACPRVQVDVVELPVALADRREPERDVGGLHLAVALGASERHSQP